MRCQEKKNCVPCWQEFQLGKLFVSVVPCIAAWYCQLVGSARGKPFMAVMPFLRDVISAAERLYMFFLTITTAGEDGGEMNRAAGTARSAGTTQTIFLLITFGGLMVCKDRLFIKLVMMIKQTSAVTDRENIFFMAIASGLEE